MLEQNPTVTISFAGLALYSVTKKNEFQVAILQCPDHELVIDVLEIALGENGEQIESKLLVSNRLTDEQNIRITAEKPKTTGIEKYENHSVEFDPTRDLGDPKDYRWIINLEDKKFGGHKLKLKPPASETEAIRLGPVITVAHGKVYTEKRSDEKFAVISLDKSDHEPPLLGRIAYRIGVDVTCDERNGGAVFLSKVGDQNQPLPLMAKPNKRYQITFENFCPPSEETRDGTDFRFVYDVISNGDENRVEERFDLQRVVENDGRGNAEDTLASNPDFSLDMFPQPCVGGDAGQGDGFPGGEG
jgi:hypothetical protein